MHDVLRERLWRHLDALPEERLYQVLDYIEFLSSKYARDAVRPPASGLQRFGERLEDNLRRNGVGLRAIRGTLEAMGTADRVVTGLTEAGRSLLREVSGGAADPPARPADRPAPAAPAPPQPGIATQPSAPAQPPVAPPPPAPRPIPIDDLGGDEPR